MAYFTTLYSGSSGNCALIRSEDKYLLIDMGKSCRHTCTNNTNAQTQISGQAPYNLAVPSSPAAAVLTAYPTPSAFPSKTKTLSPQLHTPV